MSSVPFYFILFLFFPFISLYFPYGFYLFFILSPPYLYPTPILNLICSLDGSPPSLISDLPLRQWTTPSRAHLCSDDVNARAHLLHRASRTLNSAHALRLLHCASSVAASRNSIVPHWEMDNAQTSLCLSPSAHVEGNFTLGPWIEDEARWSHNF